MYKCTSKNVLFNWLVGQQTTGKNKLEQFILPIFYCQNNFRIMSYPFSSATSLNMPHSSKWSEFILIMLFIKRELVNLLHALLDSRFHSKS